MSMLSAFAELASELAARVEEAPLVPTTVHDPAATARIDALRVPPFARAALHLLNDDLARCHELAQSEEGEASFDYLHAVVHRREGDYGNAKYWYGRVAGHPILEQVHGPDPSEALRFVDRCRRSSDREDRELRCVQARELAALLEYASSRVR